MNANGQIQSASHAHGLKAASSSLRPKNFKHSKQIGGPLQLSLPFRLGVRLKLRHQLKLNPEGFNSLARVSLTLMASLLALILGPSAQAYLETPPLYWHEGYFRISTSGSFTTTDANYDSNRGSFTSLPNGASVTHYQIQPRLRYSLNKKWSFYSGFSYSSVLAKSNAISATAERSNSQIADAHLGTSVILPFRWARAIAELEGSFAIDSVNSQRTDALVHDGVSYGRISLFAFKSFPWFKLYTHLGFKYRDEGLAALGLWAFGIEKSWARSVLIQAGVQGSETLMGDQLVSSDRTAVTDRVLQGSHLFYAYNPASLEGQLTLGYSPTPAWQTKLGYSQSFNGTNAAQTSQIFASVSFDFDPRPSRDAFEEYRRSYDYYIKNRDLARKRTKKAVQEFTVDSEKINPDWTDPDDSFEPNADADTDKANQNLLKD